LTSDFLYFGSGIIKLRCGSRRLWLIFHPL